MEPHARTAVLPLRRHILCLLGHGVLLAGCGGYDVLRGSDPGARIALAPQSVKVVLFDRNVDLQMRSHERGYGLAPAPLRPEDKRQLRGRGEQLKFMLVQALLQDVSNGLGGYVGARDPAFQLGLQINQIALDLDGSADVVVSAALTRVGRTGAALWTRTVRAGRTQFGNDTGLAGDLAAAVLAEMRASGLVG
jgi:hypothetical protein